ncbi:MAG: LmeA family phospholipid-binding protein [Actinomycetota bacterium]
MFRRVLLVFVVLMAVAYAAAEVGAKRWVEAKIARYAREQDPLAADVEAEVSAPLLFGVISRSAVDRVVVSARSVAVGTLVADRAQAELSGVHLRALESVRRGAPVVDSIDHLEASVEMTDQELSKLLPPGFRFEFEDGVPILQGPAVELRLRLRRDGTRIRLEVDPGVPLPAGLSLPVLELAEVPFLACIEEVSFRPGRMLVLCRMDHPPAALLPWWPPAG